MEFYIKTQNGFHYSMEVGAEVSFNLGHRHVDVIITKIEENKFFFKAISEDDALYLQELFNNKLSTMSIGE